MTNLDLVLIGGITGIIIALLLGVHQRGGTEMYISVPVYQTEAQNGCGGIIIVIVIVLIVLALLGSHT